MTPAQELKPQMEKQEVLSSEKPKTINEEKTTERQRSPIENKASGNTAGSEEEKNIINKQILLLLVIVLGFLCALTRLINKFYNFRGLGILANPWSWSFLIGVTVFSGISYMSLDQINIPINLPYQLLGLVVSPLLGNTVTILGRLTKTSRFDTGATGQVQELVAAKSKNILFELIREAISCRMDKEVSRLAQKFNWDEIKHSVVRLVNVSITTGRIGHKEGEEAKNFIEEIKPCKNINEDQNNRYNALHRMIQVSSFRQLCYFLEQCERDRA